MSFKKKKRDEEGFWRSKPNLMGSRGRLHFLWLGQFSEK